jgi:probable phosphoglycerate mutase
MELTVVRHGETTHNAAGIMQGHLDVDLNESGHEQTKALAKRLGESKFDIIYSSDLKRCAEMIKEISKYHSGTPVIYDSEMRERNLGELQGTKRSDLNWDNFPGTFMDKKPKGGESLNEMKERVQSFLDMLKQKHSKERVLLVAHGGFMRMLTGILSPEFSIEVAFKKFKFHNTAVCEWTIEGDKVQEHKFNDISHLAFKLND